MPTNTELYVFLKSWLCVFFVTSLTSVNSGFHTLPELIDVAEATSENGGTMTSGINTLPREENGLHGLPMERDAIEQMFFRLSDPMRLCLWHESYFGLKDASERALEDGNEMREKLDGSSRQNGSGGLSPRRISSNMISIRNLADAHFMMLGERDSSYWDYIKMTHGRHQDENDLDYAYRLEKIILNDPDYHKECEGNFRDLVETSQGWVMGETYHEHWQQFWENTDFESTHLKVYKQRLATLKGCTSEDLEGLTLQEKQASDINMQYKKLSVNDGEGSAVSHEQETEMFRKMCRRFQELILELRSVKKMSICAQEHNIQVMMDKQILENLKYNISMCAEVSIDHELYTRQIDKKRKCYLLNGHQQAGFLKKVSPSSDLDELRSSYQFEISSLLEGLKKCLHEMNCEIKEPYPIPDYRKDQIQKFSLAWRITIQREIFQAIDYLYSFRMIEVPEVKQFFSDKETLKIFSRHLYDINKDFKAKHFVPQMEYLIKNEENPYMVQILSCLPPVSQLWIISYMESFQKLSPI